MKKKDKIKSKDIKKVSGGEGLEIKINSINRKSNTFSYVRKDGGGGGFMTIKTSYGVLDSLNDNDFAYIFHKKFLSKTEHGKRGDQDYGVMG
jgi:hypothetical protein